MSQLIFTGALASAGLTGMVLLGHPTQPSDPATIEAAITCASDFVEGGAPDQAVALLQGSELRPGESLAAYEYTLARAYHKMRRPNEAHDHLERALWADPRHPGALALKSSYRHVGPQAK